MRKILIAAMTAATLAVPAVASANNGVGNGADKSPTPVAGPGCFGQWRAGSVQAINDGTIPYQLSDGSYAKNAGQVFADRGADNAAMNADARAYCATL
jgi:hypothetical protein